MTKQEVEALIGSPLKRSKSEAMTGLSYPGFLEATQEKVEVWVWFDAEASLITNSVSKVVDGRLKQATVPGLADLRPGTTMREVEAALGPPIDRYRPPRIESWSYSRQGWVWDVEVYVRFGEEELVTSAKIDYGDLMQYLCDGEDECPTAGEVQNLGFVPGVLYPRPVLGWWPFSMYDFD